MYRREGLFYKLLLAVCDAAIVAAAFGGAYALRFSFPELLPYDHIPDTGDSIWIVAFSIVSFLVVFRLRGLYRVERPEGAPSGSTRGFPESRFRELADLAAAGMLAFVTLIALAYFLAEIRYSRLTLGLFGVLAMVLFVLVRPRARAIVSMFVGKRVPARRIAILGDGHLAAKVAHTLEGHPEMGLRIVGFLGRETPLVELPGRILGSPDAIHDIIVRERIDEVVFAVPLEDHAQLPALLDMASREPVDIKVVPDLYRYVTLSGGIEEFAGLPIIRLQGTPMTPFDRFLKRGFDLVSASLILLVTSPLLLLLSILVRVTSRGPLLYAQERMGLDGRVFRMLKFRTMVADAERETGEVWAAHDDPRCTRLGRFLRRFSLDELPQLFNVWKGDMSLVGPRPERPVFIEQFREQIPKYHLRHMVKAGLTGWAQVNGWRGQTSLEKRLEHDLFYIEHWSFALDFKILLRTLAGGFLDRGAKG
jgi:Undecaprenyl-phosphate glucose phosphotransferase